MTIDIKWRVESGGNQAVQPYYHIDVVVFRHRFEGAKYDVLLVEQEWMDENPEHADYARAYIDGTMIPEKGPFSHPRIDQPTPDN